MHRKCSINVLLRLLCGILTVLLTSIGIAQENFDINALPAPTGYLSDLAHVVSAQDKDSLETLCTQVEQQLGVQIALVTLNTIGDRPIRDVALYIGRKWGVGSKKDNQGVLLLLVIKDRKSDIETGRGVEPYITDGFAGGTLRTMRPQLQAGDYGAALIMGTRAMAGQIAQGKGIAFADGILPEQRRENSRDRRGGGIPWPLIVFGFFFLLWLLGRGGRRGGGGGGGSFLTGMLLGNLLGGGRRGDGGWGGGGFGGGSGGGGGFGGFGGGDFGGGGASSNW